MFAQSAVTELWRSKGADYFARLFYKAGSTIVADVTYYVALPFGVGEDGPEPREAVECTSASAAIMRAERLARTEGNIGAVAFSRTGDPGSGEFADGVLLKAFGQVPRDLSDL
jgi:hypothetical protein